MTYQKTKAKGFTLIELVITISILVILVTIGAPSFVDTLDKRQLINATQAVSSQIQMARSIALVRNQEIQLIFNNTNEWCLGITDNLSTSDPCDCTLQATISNDGNTISFPANACTVGVPEPGSTERMLGSIQSNSFKGITLEFPEDNSSIVFEPSRGLLNDPPEPVLEYTLTSARDKKTIVSVNVVGRVKACADEESLIGGIGQCN